MGERNSTRIGGGSHGRAKAGPYSDIRPAEAGGGRYHSPPCEAGLLTTFSYARVYVYALASVALNVAYTICP
jgi:hypothetical protein